jgi:arsenate reductase (glutaredoxin)
VRAIVDEPPRPAELDAWLPASGLPARKWLNTSGASYRELGGKATFDGASDERIAAMLAGDGKLVKRPVLVDGRAVLVGFSEAAYAAHFEPPATLRSGKAPTAAPKPTAVAPKNAAKTSSEAAKAAKKAAKKASKRAP